MLRHQTIQYCVRVALCTWWHDMLETTELTAVLLVVTTPKKTYTTTQIR
jgi:hypothetical protein